MSEQTAQRSTIAPTLPSLLAPLEQLETVVDSWDDSRRATVAALRHAVDGLHKEAFARLIRAFKTDPAGLEILKSLAGDEVVYAVLRHLELVKPSLQERIESALASVRPLLQGHGGNVELISLDPPDTVHIRLLGACDGCPSSNLTLTEGIETAIRAHCPEILTIKKIAGAHTSPNGHRTTASLISPFSLSREQGWEAAASLDDIPDRGMKAVELRGHSLLLSRQAHQVTCFHNACAHMGMPLDMGQISEGIVTCPYHGFQYDLASGECLTAPEVQLVPIQVRVMGTTVEVQLQR
ncbi:MAG: Rieske domain-containing protein [Nitrospira sp.]|nr:MAG: Rieske domain-containing protein [Nitrospira sp.]